MGLRARGLDKGPKLAVGDGALGFWRALAKCYPDTVHQRCWGHKTANVLAALPKSAHPKVKDALHEVWMAETRDEAHTAFDRILVRFEAKYPKAMEKLTKDREALLAFYDFPAEHWVRIRTTNPIESTFSTVRLRSKRARNSGSRETTLAMVYKLLEVAQKKWKRLKGFALLRLVVENVKFKDRVQVLDVSDRNAARPTSYTTFDNSSQPLTDAVTGVPYGFLFDCFSPVLQPNTTRTNEKEILVKPEHIEVGKQFVVGWGTLMLINAVLAQGKNRSGLVRFFISLFLGPVTTLILALVPKLPEHQ